jgi:cyanate lyase
MDQINSSSRRQLTTTTAAVLADAHRATGLTYEQFGSLCGIDGSYWRRLTIGERCPSVPVARQIIDVLDLDPEAADRLLGEAVVGRGRYGR